MFKHRKLRRQIAKIEADIAQCQESIDIARAFNPHDQLFQMDLDAAQRQLDSQRKDVKLAKQFIGIPV